MAGKRKKYTAEEKVRIGSLCEEAKDGSLLNPPNDLLELLPLILQV